MFDHMECGSMYDIAVKFSRRLSEEFCKYTLYSVAQGLRDLHSQNIMHRDIKAKNIVFKRDRTIKITDLGCGVLLYKEKPER